VGEEGSAQMIERIALAVRGRWAGASGEAPRGGVEVERDDRVVAARGSRRREARQQ